MKRARDPYDDDDCSSSESEDLHPKKLPEEDDSPQPSQPIQRKHYCVICEKQFSSGKAYGGHVRIHSTEYNNKGKMKKKPKKMKMKRKMEKEKEKRIDLIRCCLCGKEFQRMHSLFGHMRGHPDRSWKGIRPPPPSQVNFKLNHYDDDGSDDESGDDSEDEVERAAYILLMMNWASIRMNGDMESSPKSEVRCSSCSKDDGDMKIEMETYEVKIVNEPQGHEAKRPLGFDINQPYNENDDHPYSS